MRVRIADVKMRYATRFHFFERKETCLGRRLLLCAASASFFARKPRWFCGGLFLPLLFSGLVVGVWTCEWMLSLPVRRLRVRYSGPRAGTRFGLKVPAGSRCLAARKQAWRCSRIDAMSTSRDGGESNTSRRLRVAIEGCCHGELDKIYDEVKRRGPIDLLLICGDFHALRDEDDLCCMSVPPKYRDMGTFYKYYSGEKVAPVLTICVGGNHEASNHFQELFYGGYVAPNIYYMGCAGVVNVGGLRIAGLSGIYNENTYSNPTKSRYEHPPYTPSAVRSVYHTRPFQVMQMKLLEEKIDVFLSHDWPRGIYHHGDVEGLLRKKKFLRKDIEKDQLGCKGCSELLHSLRPPRWFSAHYHCRFEAKVQHMRESDSRKRQRAETEFLSLDKCLPGRRFLEVVELTPDAPPGKLSVRQDPEWLAILKCTQPYVASRPSETPGIDFFQAKLASARKEVDEVYRLDQELREGVGFVKTVATYKPRPKSKQRLLGSGASPRQRGNPQTDALLATLGLEHVPPVTVSVSQGSSQRAASSSTSAIRDENEIDLDL